MERYLKFMNIFVVLMVSGQQILASESSKFVVPESHNSRKLKRTEKVWSMVSNRAEKTVLNSNDYSPQEKELWKKMQRKRQQENMHTA